MLQPNLEVTILVIPAALLRRFYVDGSLESVKGGVRFVLQNGIAPATIVSIGPVEIDGVPYAPGDITLTASKPRRASAVTASAPLLFDMGMRVILHVASAALPPGEHEVALHAITREVGPVLIAFTASV